jgi:hypothetical protein
MRNGDCEAPRWGCRRQKDLAGFRQIIWSTHLTPCARNEHLLIIDENLPGLRGFTSGPGREQISGSRQMLDR